MKILYIGNDRRAAGVAARALSGIAPNVTVAWTQTLSSAVSWVLANRDAAAVIVAAEAQSQGCASFVQQVRGLGLTMPVVVVGPDHPGAPLDALDARPDGYVVDGHALEADLPRIVTAAIARERSRRDVVERQLAERAASRDQAEQPFARAEDARQQTEQRCASELAGAASRLAEVQESHTRSLAREARICTALQQRLIELETALQVAEERRAADAVASAGQLANRHAEFTASLTQAAHARDTLATKLSVATTALDEAQQARRADAAAAAAHLARRDAELGATLAEAIAARTALESALTEAAAAYQHLQQRAGADLAVAADREAALQERLAQEADTRAILEQRLGAAEAARQDAEQRYATELTTAALRLADVQARFDAALTESGTARAALEQQLTGAVAAFQRATQERESDATAASAHLARREAELGATVAEAFAARTAVEGALTEAQAAHRQALERAAADLAAAGEREGALEDLLAQEAERRTILEQRFAAAEDARHGAEQRSATEVTTLEMRLTDVQARYDTALTEHGTARAALDQQLADAAAALERATQEHASEAVAAAAHLARREAELGARLAEAVAARTALEGALIQSERQLEVRSEEIRRIQQERETARRLLGTTQEQLQRLHSTVDEERQGYERARSASESELQRLSAESDQLRQSLDQLRTAFRTVEQIAGEHAIERARLESVVAQRDGELSAQAARHLAADRDAQDALSQSQEKLRRTLESSSSDIARLEQQIKGLRQELDATRTRAEALRSEAERLPLLQMQLDESEKERRREFERAPYGLCQCTSDGVITRVNHSLVRLLGHRRADDLTSVDFAGTGFECPDDVRWLIERAVRTKKTEALETTRNTRDRRRLVVRLHALSTTSGSVGIIVEDITNVRALEQRLRQAQRLEAVGRLASEVAVTCDSVLRDAVRDGDQWLAATGSDTRLRRQGELLLAEVRRAVSLLRQFAAYGNRQMSALEPVSVPSVFRDLEPVLKRLAGDDIELVFAASAASLEVDVEAERLERIFVNVVNYARERMPYGGEVRIDVAPTVVGRRLIAKSPNARPGPHVLITISERRRADREDGPSDLRAIHDAAGGVGSGADKPGLDVSALLELVVNSGGHLWMEAERAGNMLLKIHLPKRADEDVTGSAAPITPSDAGRRLAKWFRTKSTAVAGS